MKKLSEALRKESEAMAEDAIKSQKKVSEGLVKLSDVIAQLAVDVDRGDVGLDPLKDFKEMASKANELRDTFRDSYDLWNLSERLAFFAGISEDTLKSSESDCLHSRTGMKKTLICLDCGKEMKEICQA